MPVEALLRDGSGRLQGRRVPQAYRRLFETNPEILLSHRGFDIGILKVARRIARILRTPLFACHTTRLLIDPNRSLGHTNLFSEFSKSLPDSEKEWLIHNLYHPHREAVSVHVKQLIESNLRVLHLSLHSFTPILRERKRRADIGILYDPRRLCETALAKALQKNMKDSSALRIRRNYPYYGHSDGFTTALRKIHGERRYLGLEIEINQGMLSGKRSRAAWLADLLCRSLKEILEP